MNTLICLPSGTIINLDHFRCCVKTGLTECVLMLAGCPPVPGTIQDYDVLKGMTKPMVTLQ